MLGRVCPNPIHGFLQGPDGRSTTSHASPCEDQLAGEPVFSFYSSAEIYLAIGPNPDATNGTRRFLTANTPIDIFGDRGGGEKVAWI